MKFRNSIQLHPHVLVFEIGFVCVVVRLICFIVYVSVVSYALAVPPHLDEVAVEFLAFRLHSLPMRLQLIHIPLNVAFWNHSIIGCYDFIPERRLLLSIANLRSWEMLDQTTASYFESNGLYTMGFSFPIAADVFCLTFPLCFDGVGYFDEGGTLETLSNELERFICSNPCVAPQPPFEGGV